MFKNLTFLALALLMTSCPQDIGQILDSTIGGTTVESLTNGEIVGGLKEALSKGAGNSSDLLSRADGFYKSPYKILLPAEARKVTDRLQGIPGFAQLEENILEKINRGAEDAAKSAKPIFLRAIRSMSVRDALGILKGEKDAATTYLKRTTFDQLYNEFNPVIVESLDKFNARTTWTNAVTAYNKIPFNSDKADPNLDDYITKKALDGLFLQVAKEELDIRTNLRSRTTDLLRKVFAEQD